MSNSLLLISSRPEDQAFLTEVAAEAGLSMKHVADPKEGAKILQEQDSIILFADVSTEAIYQALENALQETVGLFSDKVDANKIHFISSAEIDSAPYVTQSPLFGHYIIRNFTQAKEAGQQYGRLLKSTLTDKAFGLSKMLKPETKIQVIKLTSSAQKQDAVEAIKSYLLAAKFQSRTAAVIANAVDEILMNSIFDAPIDELGKPTLVATPRSTVIPLEGKSAVEMNIGFDGHIVGISAIDHYGSLDKAKMLTHISKVYTHEEYKVRTTTAGAGIGLSNIFRSGGSFYFISESRIQTEVMVFFKRTDSFREFKDQFRFISTQFYF